MRIGVIGPLEVRTDDLAPVHLPGPRERLLLAALTAAAPQAVGVDELATILRQGAGPDAAPPDAADADGNPEALRGVVLRLRTALEPRLPPNVSGRHVLRRGPGYALALPGSEIDAVRVAVLVERARAQLAAGDATEAERLFSAALRLWRGEPYADWPDAEFAAPERRRLSALRAEAEAGLLQARSRPARGTTTGAALRPAPIRFPPPALVPVEPEPHVAGEDELVPDPARSGQPGRLALVALLLIGALLAAVLTVRSQPAAEQPTAGADPVDLAGDAERLAELSVTTGALDVSLLLAVQAFRMEQTSETRNALRAALLGHPRVERVGRIPGLPQAAVLSGRSPTLHLATMTDLVAWEVGDGTHPEVLLPIPREWGFWSAAIPSPTDDGFVAVGHDGELPWVRTVSAEGGAARLLLAGNLAGDMPVDGAVSSDGRRILLLLVEPVGRAPRITTNWRVVELDAAAGRLADTAIAGTLPFPTGTLAVDFSADASTLVLWNRIGDAATLVHLADGSQAPIRARPDVSGTTTFRALPGGAARLGTDGEIVLVDRNGHPLQVLDEHDTAVYDVTVSPDGTWAASGGEGLLEGELYRWTVDPATGRWSSPEALSGHAAAVLDVEVDVRGERLVTVSLDRTTISWRSGAAVQGSAVADGRGHVRTQAGEDLAAAACAVVARDFTPEEWKRYLPGRPFGPTCTDLS